MYIERQRRRQSTHQPTNQRERERGRGEGEGVCITRTLQRDDLIGIPGKHSHKTRERTKTNENVNNACASVCLVEGTYIPLTQQKTTTTTTHKQKTNQHGLYHMRSRQRQRQQQQQQTEIESEQRWSILGSNETYNSTHNHAENTWKKNTHNFISTQTPPCHISSL